MLMEQDLQELEHAARLIISVIERRRIHEEDAIERRALFRFVKNEPPEPYDSSGVLSEQGFVEFTEKEILQMPKKIQRLIILNKKRCHIRTKPSGKDSVTYEIRYRRDGYNVYANGKTIELAKENFLRKIKTAKPKDFGADERDVPTTFKAFALFYFEAFRKEKVTADTYKADEGRLKKHLLPYFKEMPLRKITPFDCKRFLDNVLSQGKGKTAEELYSILSILFKGAIAHGIMDRNPLLTVSKPTYEQKSGKALSRSEEQTLFEKLAGSGHETAVAVLLYCGLRPNELATAKIHGGFIVAVNSKRKNRKVEYKRIPICKKLRPYLPDDGELSLAHIKWIRVKYKEILPHHRLYDLRTTFYTRCDELGVAESARDEFVGHSAGVLTNAYRDLSDEYLLKEGKKLDEW